MSIGAEALDAPAAADAAPALFDAPELAIGALLARAETENFPVALRVLPRATRDALLAVYAFVRLVDEVGDAASGDRTAALDWLAADVGRIETDAPRHPVVRRLASAVRIHALPLRPFERLIEANRSEQAGVAIASWGALLDSCHGTADPIGEVVLALFGRASSERIALSNAVCSALQIVEHCQDVAEDHAAGRVYLPAVDLDRAGCAPGDLGRVPASPALRRVVALQVDRCRDLLRAADALVGQLDGWARVLVAAYAAGGLATCDALARHGYDVTGRAVRPRRRDVLRRWLGIVWRSAWRRA